MGTILFDFDGTLAHRPGMWSQCLVDVLDDLVPGHGVVADDFRPLLRDGFPWHRPDAAHVELSTADAWWDDLEPLVRRAFTAVGVDKSMLSSATRDVRSHYCDPTQFELFPDTVPSLTLLKNRGWDLFILSNHVPELASIVARLGLGILFNKVFSSAVTGYEKPNPEAYRIALDGIRPSECFMVGDNVFADVIGAERVGLPAILVRADHPDATRSAADLFDAVELILSADPPK